MLASSRRITGDFHEKAGPCQAFFLVVPFVQPTADQREALLAFSLSFIERFLFGHRDSRSPTSGRRTRVSPSLSSAIADSPCFHSHSGVSLTLGAVWGSRFSNRCCHLSVELDSTPCGIPAPPRPRSHLNSAIPYSPANLYAACARWLRSGSYTSPLTHNRCSRIDSFRATATTARLCAFLPPRAASFTPQRFKSVSGPKRLNM